MNKDSCCYNCESRSGDCHTSCKYYAAEREARDYDNAQRLVASLGVYRNETIQRNALRQVQFDRSGGR